MEHELEIRITNFRYVDGPYWYLPGYYGHHLYTIETQGKLFNGEVLKVERRYDDFNNVLSGLSQNEDYKGFNWPDLPPKKKLKILHTDEFIEQRRIGLEQFLKDLIASHESLKCDALVQAFLTCSSDDWAMKINQPSVFSAQM